MLSYLPRVALTASACYILCKNIAGFKEVNLAFNVFTLFLPLSSWPSTIKPEKDFISLPSNSFAITNVLLESATSYFFPNWINDITRTYISFFASSLIGMFYVSIAKEEKKNRSRNMVNKNTPDYITHALYSLHHAPPYATVNAIIYSAFVIPAFWLSGIEETMGFEYVCSSILTLLITRDKSSKNNSEQEIY